MFVTSSETARLLSSVGFHAPELERAIDAGAVVKVKVEGIWLYHPANESIEDALALVEKVTQSILSEYFIVSMPMLASMVAKRVSSGQITWGAIKPVVRRLMRRRRFGAIGLLTGDDFLPYLAIHLDSDTAVVVNMVEIVGRKVVADGVADQSAVPGAPRRLRVQGWKQTVLAHCEFLGLGAIRDGSLVAWDQL
jgi:hypothetical protein